MNPFYVLLTGSKNNAGDFLIKYRGKKLLEIIRKDRELIDYQGWKPFTPEQLEVINQSKALILLGGPALQYNMVPNVYHFNNNINQIKVPIIPMGIGWKGMLGTWKETQEYKFSPLSIQLLERIQQSGYNFSVRDYHSLNVLFSKGYKNVMMTGCPVLYDTDFLNQEFIVRKVKKISFSVGVSFIKSKQNELILYKILNNLKEYFKNQDLTIVFHHSVNKKVYKT